MQSGPHLQEGAVVNTVETDKEFFLIRLSHLTKPQDKMYFKNEVQPRKARMRESGGVRRSASSALISSLSREDECDSLRAGSDAMSN